MGQPVRGIRENVNNITHQNLQEWHNNFCVGKNLVIVASGDVNHEAVSDKISKAFSDLPHTRGVELAN